VVTEPLAGVSIIILPDIVVISRLNRFAHSREIKECVAPVSIMAIKRTLLMKQVPQIKLSELGTSSPLKENTFPLA